MGGGSGWSKRGIGKSRRSSKRASIPSRFWRCCRIHRAGFSENLPSRVLPMITEIVIIVSLLCEIQGARRQAPDLSRLDGRWLRRYYLAAQHHSVLQERARQDGTKSERL